MNDITHYSYYRRMTDTNIDLAFKGPFSHEILLSLADVILETVDSKMPQQKNSKKVFAVFIELTQNIRDYSIEKKATNGKSFGTGLVTLQENHDEFIITSGNLVTNETAKTMIEYCDYLNSLEKDELKNIYKEKMNEPSTDSSGGGVGLITIKRKTDIPFETKVETVDEHTSFFVLTVKIVKENIDG